MLRSRLTLGVVGALLTASGATVSDHFTKSTCPAHECKLLDNESDELQLLQVQSSKHGLGAASAQTSSADGSSVVHPCDSGNHDCDSESSFCAPIGRVSSNCLARSTTFTDDGGGNAVFLDRQDVSCPNDSFLSRMQLRAAQSKINYDYTCCMRPGFLGATCTSKKTALSDDGGGNIQFFDRHNVQCGHNSFINRVQLSRAGTTNQIQFEYACCQLPDIQTTCRVAKTGFRFDGGGSLTSLQEHNIQCGEDEYLTQIQLDRGGSDDEFQYVFTCCSFVSAVAPSYECACLDGYIADPTSTISCRRNTVRDHFDSVEEYLKNLETEANEAKAAAEKARKEADEAPEDEEKQEIAKEKSTLEKLKSKNWGAGKEVLFTLWSARNTIKACEEKTFCDGAKLAVDLLGLSAACMTAVGVMVPYGPMVAGIATLVLNFFRDSDDDEPSAPPLTFDDVREALRLELLQSKLDDVKTTLTTISSSMDTLYNTIRPLTKGEKHFNDTKRLDQFKDSMKETVLEIRAKIDALVASWDVIRKFRVEVKNTVPFDALCDIKCSTGKKWDDSCFDTWEKAKDGFAQLQDVLNSWKTSVGQMSMVQMIIRTVYEQHDWPDDFRLDQLQHSFRPVLNKNRDHVNKTLQTMHWYCADGADDTMEDSNSNFPVALAQHCPSPAQDWTHMAHISQSRCNFNELLVAGGAPFCAGQCSDKDRYGKGWTRITQTLGGNNGRMGSGPDGRWSECGPFLDNLNDRLMIRGRWPDDSHSGSTCGKPCDFGGSKDICLRPQVCVSNLKCRGSVMDEDHWLKVTLPALDLEGAEDIFPLPPLQVNPPVFVPPVLSNSKNITNRSDRLIKGDPPLQENDALFSPDGQWALLMQEDGNLVQRPVHPLSPGVVCPVMQQRFKGGKAWVGTWSADMEPHFGREHFDWRSGPHSAEMQVDGNFVIYGENRKKVWSTNRDDLHEMVIQNNGAIVWNDEQGRMKMATCGVYVSRPWGPDLSWISCPQWNGPKGNPHPRGNPRVCFDDAVRYNKHDPVCYPSGCQSYPLK